MNGTLATTSDDAVGFFTQSPGARRKLDAWKPRRPHVTRRVLQHRSEAVYRIASSDVAELASAHPLGRVRPPQGYGVEEIRDWFPDFAFTHIFHFHLEDLGRVFSFEEFRDMSAREGWSDLLWRPAQARIRKAVAGGCTPEDAKAAMMWRIGLAYYSFLREAYTVARLRELGADMRVHPLADALFRADAWCGSAVFSLYVRNKKFRDDTAGRKPQVEELLGPGRPELRFVALRMEVQHAFGRVHLPSDAQIEQCAREIRQAPA